VKHDKQHGKSAREKKNDNEIKGHTNNTKNQKQNNEK
jgi:hypothetical protein